MTMGDIESRDYSITFYKGEMEMDAVIYTDLEECRDYDQIDVILAGHGYKTTQEKYTYLINRMGVISAQFTGITDDDFDTMYGFAKESYLLDHWRAEA